MANVVYTGCRIRRIKIHGRDRKILGTNGSMSYMANCRICRSRICRILLYFISSKFNWKKTKSSTYGWRPNLQFHIFSIFWKMYSTIFKKSKKWKIAHSTLILVCKVVFSFVCNRLSQKILKIGGEDGFSVKHFLNTKIMPGNSLKVKKGVKFRKTI